MDRSTNQFISISVKHSIVSCLSLNTLCHIMVLWKRFWECCSIDSSFFKVHFSATVPTESSCVYTTEPALVSSLFLCEGWRKWMGERRKRENLLCQHKVRPLRHRLFRNFAWNKVIKHHRWKPLTPRIQQGLYLSHMMKKKWCKTFTSCYCKVMFKK